MMFHQTFTIAREAAISWHTHKASRIGAAIAFYATFSIAPLAIIAIAIASRFFGDSAAQGQIVILLQGSIGTGPALFIQRIIENASQPVANTKATILGILFLLYGASNIFHHLRGALNTMWGVQGKDHGIVRGIIRDRIRSLVFVFLIGILLVVLIAGSTGLATLGSLISDGGYGKIAWHMFNGIIVFTVLVLLLAIVYKMLPAAKIEWRDVVVGSIVTALLLAIGNVIIGLYLQRSAIASVYGAVGSLLVLLLWIYYSMQIFFIGAEFTHIYANRFGSRIISDEGAQSRKKRKQ